jgi:hypothetical protein
VPVSIISSIHKLFHQDPSHYAPRCYGCCFISFPPVRAKGPAYPNLSFTKFCTRNIATVSSDVTPVAPKLINHLLSVAFIADVLSFLIAQFYCRDQRWTKDLKYICLLTQCTIFFHSFAEAISIDMAQFFWYLATRNSVTFYVIFSSVCTVC